MKEEEDGIYFRWHLLPSFWLTNLAVQLAEKSHDE
jgi:hypothetical protein